MLGTLGIVKSPIHNQMRSSVGIRHRDRLVKFGEQNVFGSQAGNDAT